MNLNNHISNNNQRINENYNIKSGTLDNFVQKSTTISDN